MSTSKTRRGRVSARGRRAVIKLAREGGVFRLPLTVSHASLLDNGADTRFRQLVYDLLTITARMSSVREHLGRRMGVTGPQYEVLMAIAQLQGGKGIGVGAIARRLHVSSAFIATETGKLALAGLVVKRPNPKDRRGVLLSLTRAAQGLIERNSAEIRSINDVFFGSLNRSAFASMSSATAALVQSSQRVMARLDNVAEPPTILPEAAE